MNTTSEHTFHIPVMGLGYTIDTPVKVARYGISSVVSIIQDYLVEQMREFYCKKQGITYVPISTNDLDYRAKRITAYLNLLQDIVDEQMEIMKKESLDEGKDIVKYFQLLPENSPLKKEYLAIAPLKETDRKIAFDKLKDKIIPGKIDVNIMTKIDNQNFSKDNEPLAPEFSDAVAAFRGFAESKLSSSVIFSAGLNPRLFSYIENYKDFFPNENGVIKKKVILKVSDYRSALIQGKFLAKKGIWVTEFRIESGLNCGGHAFPTEGLLLGPILEEFKVKKLNLSAELLEICNKALLEKKKTLIPINSIVRISVQGGIGTANEDQFLREYYEMDSTGWGSPFLLVPEATNVDAQTLNQLIAAQPDDYYLSHSSPLGIPFNNFRNSTSEKQRMERINKNRPGSPCYKKYLSFNNEFTEKPICVSSRQYQNLKLKELENEKIHSNLNDTEYKKRFDEIVEKDCLCEGLTTTALLVNNIKDDHDLTAVVICPGPNLAYFSKLFTLEEMVGHIYGRANILNSNSRPHTFVNELKMYVKYLQDEIKKNITSINEKQNKYYTTFKNNLVDGIEYYFTLIPKFKNEVDEFKIIMKKELEEIKNMVINANIPLTARG